MEGKLNFFAVDRPEGNKPHFKGYIEIDGQVHEFAAWPARSGKGFSGRYKPKGEKPAKQEEVPF